MPIDDEPVADCDCIAEGDDTGAGFVGRAFSLDRPFVGDRRNERTEVTASLDIRALVVATAIGAIVGALLGALAGHFI